MSSRAITPSKTRTVPAAVPSVFHSSRPETPLTNAEKYSSPLNTWKLLGLEEPLPMSHIMWGGVRDLDPLEADRFREYEVRQVSVEDIREINDNFRNQFDALADEVDVVYVHVDMDVLEPDEVPGHGLAVPNGPSSMALGAAIGVMFENPKTVALGIASTPSFNRDRDGRSRRAASPIGEGIGGEVVTRATFTAAA